MSTRMNTISASSSYFSSNFKACDEIHVPHSKGKCSKNNGRPQPKLFMKLTSKQEISRDNRITTRRSNKFRTEASSSPSSSSSSSPNPSSSPWKKWVWGILLSVILPAAGHKGGLLMGLKVKIDQAIETVETVAETVEEIAAEAEKIAEEVEEKLPGDSKIKEALDSFEDLTKMAAKEAKKAQEITQKVKEVEEEIEEALIKSIKDGPPK